MRAPSSALSPRREDHFLLPFHIQSRRSEVEGGPFRVQDGVFIFSGAHRVEGMSLPAQPYLTLLPAAFKPRGLGCEFPPQDPGMCGIPGSPLFGQEEIPPGCLPTSLPLPDPLSGRFLHLGPSPGVFPLLGHPCPWETTPFLLMGLKSTGRIPSGLNVPQASRINSMNMLALRVILYFLAAMFF